MLREGGGDGDGDEDDEGGDRDGAPAVELRGRVTRPRGGPAVDARLVWLAALRSHGQRRYQRQGRAQASGDEEGPAADSAARVGRVPFRVALAAALRRRPREAGPQPPSSSSSSDGDEEGEVGSDAPSNAQSSDRRNCCDRDSGDGVVDLTRCGRLERADAVMLVDVLSSVRPALLRVDLRGVALASDAVDVLRAGLAHGRCKVTVVATDEATSPAAAACELTTIARSNRELSLLRRGLRVAKAKAARIPKAEIDDEVQLQLACRRARLAFTLVVDALTAVAEPALRRGVELLQLAKRATLGEALARIREAARSEREALREAAAARRALEDGEAGVRAAIAGLSETHAAVLAAEFGPWKRQLQHLASRTWRRQSSSGWLLAARSIRGDDSPTQRSPPPAPRRLSSLLERATAIAAAQEPLPPPSEAEAASRVAAAPLVVCRSPPQPRPRETSGAAPLNGSPRPVLVDAAAAVSASPLVQQDGLRRQHSSHSSHRPITSAVGSARFFSPPPSRQAIHDREEVL